MGSVVMATLPETRKPEPVWVEMPKTIKQLVVDHVDVITRKSMFPSCKELKELVCNAYIKNCYLEVKFCDDFVSVELTSRKIWMKETTTEKKEFEEAAKRTVKYLSRKRFQMVYIIDHQNKGGPFYKLLKGNLENMNPYIHVETIAGTPEAIRILLPKVLPGVCSGIIVTDDGSKAALRSLTSLEQWKQLQYINVKCESDLLAEDGAHARRYGRKMSSE